MLTRGDGVQCCFSFTIRRDSYAIPSVSPSLPFPSLSSTLPSPAVR